MEDQDFKNMVLLGLSNIQWMLMQTIINNTNDKYPRDIKDECRKKNMDYVDNCLKYVND